MEQKLYPIIQFIHPFHQLSKHFQTYSNFGLFKKGIYNKKLVIKHDMSIKIQPFKL